MQTKKLLKEFGSPLYTYDEATIIRRCSAIMNFEVSLQQKLEGPDVNMHYSTKTNNNPAILNLVEKLGLNVDCMSPLELKLNEACGFTPDRMLYVCNNISVDEMELVHDKGILICLDSISQVETWGKNFPNTDIMVRINPGLLGVGHSEKVVTSGKSTKFGISKDSFDALLKVTQKYDLNIIGIHQHLGSLFLDDKIPDYIAGVKEGLNLVKSHFSDVKIIDLGGGFGVPYTDEEKPLNFTHLIDELIPVLKEFCSEYPSVTEFKFEPGRYIPCESGQLIGTVTSTKYENGVWWIGTDIGMNQLVRPSLYDAFHKITLPETSPSSPLVVANFCGNICESGDILGKNREVHLPKVGDPVVVHNAGAYGYSMASNYTGRPRPAEVMIRIDGTTKIIRTAETLESMMSNIVW